MGFQFDLRRRSLFPYLLTYVIALVLFPEFKIMFSSPMLAAALYRLNWNRFLWFGLGAGLFLDLLTSDSPIGFYGTSYLLTCVALSRFKQYFFSDSLSTLPIMTFFGSILQSTTALILAPFFDLSTRFNLGWVLSDLICMPALDGAVAFSYFILVPMIFQSRARRRQEYFMKDEP